MDIITPSQNNFSSKEDFAQDSDFSNPFYEMPKYIKNNPFKFLLMMTQYLSHQMSDMMDNNEDDDKALDTFIDFMTKPSFKTAIKHHNKPKSYYTDYDDADSMENVFVYDKKSFEDIKRKNDNDTSNNILQRQTIQTNFNDITINNPRTWDTYERGQEVIDGWYSTGDGQVEIGQAHNYGLPESPTKASQYLELNGHSAGILSKNLPTSSGKKYTLSFNHGNRSGGDDIKDFAVKIGDQIFDFSTGDRGTWKNETIEFTPTSDNTEISFIGKNKAHASYGAIINDIIITQLENDAPKEASPDDDVNSNDYTNDYIISNDSTTDEESTDPDDDVNSNDYTNDYIVSNDSTTDEESIDPDDVFTSSSSYSTIYEQDIDPDDLVVY